ncbi:hypothetical protein SAMN05421770_1086 [Granulicella rosea]|uniref:DUF1680 family protein n=1 Tax=Granulicella rosea TaxID=474952 RepID=A0A239LXB3_9BACT|nr:glycoside hydrolase family 127 protein [Granulicella rosea]SNT34443.1 hypothetical protein SAMN05421770_1086 [Granulicella rosea]
MTDLKNVDRRTFTRALALTPLALASRSLLGQSAAPSQKAKQADPVTQEKKQAGAAPAAKRIPKTAADYNKHPPIVETEPFAAPLTFSRRILKPKVSPFALNEVTLDAGPLQQARDWNRAYMLRLPNDRLLHNFRVTAGIPSSATPLGGWEAPTAELRGHFVGHYLSASAMLHAATGDTAIKQKAGELVAGIGECQKRLKEDGFVAAYPSELFVRLDKREKVWAPFYTLHKIMAGLLDMHTLAGNGQALEIVIGMAGWVDVWTASKSEAHMQEILKTEYGGMNEVLYNLAAVTGDDRWATTGDRFTKKTFFNPLAMRRDELKGLHCNTHMPQVIGAARRYELSSDQRFGEVTEFFFETVSRSRTYATGGSGNTEGWLTVANHLALEKKASSHHQECCCAYNMIKLSRHIYGWSADPRIIDYYERNLLNHRLGTIEPETGVTTYFLSMSPGAWKTTNTDDQTFWCCTGSALEDFAKLNDTIYFHSEEGLYVNLFVPSHLHWKDRGIRLQQKTSFPEGDSSTLVIQATPAAEWTMHLRIPEWTTTASTVRINGVALGVAGTPGTYLTIRRAWKVGDRVELVMPMRLTAEPLRDDVTQVAFLFGPVVLAGQFPRGEIDFDLQHNQGPEIQELPPLPVPSFVAKTEDPASWLKPVSGQPLTFRTVGQSGNVTLKPLNQSWERFSVYFSVV